MSLLPALIAAGVAVGSGLFFPLLSPLLIALLLGAVVANVRIRGLDEVRERAAASRVLLRWGVVLLGLKLPLSEIARIGPSGILVVVVTVALTFAATLALGRWLGLDRGFVTLVATGFSICGAAAIAAVEDAVGAKRRDVTLAVALVTLFGSAMIVVLPWLASLLGLSETQTAVWAGASIHEVAQVVAAASGLGAAAAAIATTVKLGRVALLAPVYGIAAHLSRTRMPTPTPTPSGAGRVPRAPWVPWFVIGFAVAVAVRSLGLLPEPVFAVTDIVTTFLLAAGMFGLGLGLDVSELWPVPLRAFALGAMSTIVAAGGSLALVLLTA